MADAPGSRKRDGRERRRRAERPGGGSNEAAAEEAEAEAAAAAGCRRARRYLRIRTRRPAGSRCVHADADAGVAPPAAAPIATDLPRPRRAARPPSDPAAPYSLRSSRATRWARRIRTSSRRTAAGGGQQGICAADMQMVPYPRGWWRRSRRPGAPMAQQMMLTRAPHAQMGQQGVPQQMIGMQPDTALQGVPMGYPQVHGAAAHAWSRNSTVSSPASRRRPRRPRRPRRRRAGGVPERTARRFRRRRTANAAGASPGPTPLPPRRARRRRCRRRRRRCLRTRPGDAS